MQAKPMLSRAALRCSRGPSQGRRRARLPRFWRKRPLLAAVLQHLMARLRDLRTVLLQAREDHEVALADDVAAVALNVAVAGRLLLGRAAALWLRGGLGESRRGG